MAFMDDYVSVNERIEQFLAKYPDGRIQTDIAHLSDTLVVMKATVYRTEADRMPSIAHSQLGIPGKTSFTKDSEVENAETSAVGRALAFMGFETKKGLASREEVQSRRPVNPETGEVHDDFDKLGHVANWRAGLISGLAGRDLVMLDLVPIVGAVSREDYALKLDDYFAAHPGKTLNDLLDEAQRIKLGGEPVGVAQ